MPHPTYNGQPIPVYSVPPNWKATVTLRTIYQTIVRESLDLSEERQERQPRCLYGVRYQPLTLSGQETGYIRRVVELAQAMPIVMPVWTEACMVMEAASAGATTLAVDDTTQTLFSILPDYVFIFRDFKTWEILEVESIDAELITLAEPTAFAWQAGDMVFPILIGKLPRTGMKAATDIHSTQDVDFEERFNGLTNQSIVETSTDPLEFTFTSECRDEMECSFPVPDGETYRLQIAEFQDGPWANHIFVNGDETGERTLALNNDYEGEAWFRVVNAEGQVIRSPVNPVASVLAPPTLDSISGTQMEIAPRGLHNDDGFVYPYSIIENGMIANSETYQVPRGRWHYVTDDDELWDGTPHVPSITAEDGAVVKWTRDGSDPTEDTIIKKYDGHENNLAAYREDFAFVLKIRCFKDGCRSPLTTILVDRQLGYLAEFHSVNGLSNDIGGYCDLPRPPDGAEAFWSCNVRYGGTGGFDEHLFDLVLFSGVGVANGEKMLYTLNNNTVTSTYIGYPVHGSSWEYYEHTEGGSVIDRPAIRWDPLKPCWTFFYAQTSDALVETYLGPTIFGATITTPLGVVGPFEEKMDDYIAANIPHAPEVSDPVTLEMFKLVLTVHHDFVLLTDPEYVPPVVEIPVVPSVDIYGDDFEEYAPGAPGVLNEGTGWAGPWTLVSYAVAIEVGYDDFENYEDGDAEADPLDSGELWEDDWVFIDLADDYFGEDDFESYSDGAIDNLLLSDGTNWEGAWIVYDYTSTLGGGDDFQAYADGAVAAGVAADLDEGSGWNLAGSWKFLTALGAGSYRYYRLVIDQNNGDASFTGVLEFELRTVALGTNYAATANGGVATASAADASGPASEAIDGSLGSGFGWVVALPLPVWLRVDLGTARTITEYKVGSYSTSTTTANRSARQWRLEGSNDGVLFDWLASGESQTGWTFGELRTFTI